jgi:hypothetical protein
MVGMMMSLLPRMGQQVDGAETEGVEERRGVAGGLLDRVGGGAGGGGDTGVVEQDDFALKGERVGQRRVVVVEVAHEVLDEDQGDAVGGTEAAVGEANAVRLDELGGNGVVRVCGHDYLSGAQKRVQMAVRPPSAATVVPVT